MRVIEQFVRSKTGREEDCEDLVVVTDVFVAVIDGETDKTGETYDGLFGGKFAGVVLKGEVGQLPPDCDVDTCVERLTNALSAASGSPGARTGSGDGGGRPSAVIAMYSPARREVWRIGDVGIRVGSRVYAEKKGIDRVLSEARAALLEAHLIEGVSIDALRSADPGREMILPALREQHVFRNAMGAKYGFGCVDGSPIPSAYREVFRVDAGETVVLATDGYPLVGENLRASEAYLSKSLAEDPLRIGVDATTKGVGVDEESFDDRAYLRLEV